MLLSLIQVLVANASPSVIGRGNTVGYNICNSDFPTASQNNELSQKVVEAGQALQDDYQFFEKHLEVSEFFSNRPGCFSMSYIGEHNTYWFHFDHLGSLFYISNKDGEISQYLEYFPFGETLVEEHKNSNNSPCKFNAKELDNETGNYYYGARYYNPKFSIWLSVDPLAEKYPGWSPYNYTLLNPVVFVDPDGKSVDIPDNWYEDKKSGEVIWLNSTKEYDGYKNLGYHSCHTDGWGKRTHYNGDTRTKYVNYEPVKTYKESSLRQTYNFVTDELVAPVLEGAQIVGRHIPLAVGKAVSLSYKDIKAGGDGANIHADMKMPMYTFQNGKMRKTDLNEYSSGEISSSGFSALTAPVNMVKSGIKGIGAYINFISDQTISFFAGKIIENLDENK